MLVFGDKTKNKCSSKFQIREKDFCQRIIMHNETVCKYYRCKLLYSSSDFMLLIQILLIKLSLWAWHLFLSLCLILVTYIQGEFKYRFKARANISRVQCNYSNVAIHTIHCLTYWLVIHESASCSVLRCLHENNSVPVCLQSTTQRVVK